MEYYNPLIDSFSHTEWCLVQYTGVQYKPDTGLLHFCWVRQDQDKKNVGLQCVGCRAQHWLDKAHAPLASGIGKTICLIDGGPSSTDIGKEISCVLCFMLGISHTVSRFLCSNSSSVLLFHFIFLFPFPPCDSLASLGLYSLPGYGP